MSWFNWLKGKSRTPVADATKVAPPKTEKAQPQKKDDADPQQKLWSAESSSAMRSLIPSMTEQALTDLVNAIAFVDFPLNALASAGGSLDKRSTLTVHFTFQLLKAGKHSQANQLLNKVLDKMRAKLATGAREGGAVPQGREQAFESAFAAGDMGSATEILKQNRSTDFWRIDEALKREIYDLAMEMLKKDRNREAAILLDAVMLDYPHDLDTEFWRVAAYHNIFNGNKSDNQAKHNAKQAIGSFLHKAEGNQQYVQKCSDFRNILSEQYGAEEEGNLSRWRNSGEPKQWVEEHGYSWNHQDWLLLLEDLRKSPYWPMNPDKVGALLDEIRPSPAKQTSAEPEVQDLTFSTNDPYLAAALFVRYISKHGCGCGGEWERQTGDLYQCGKCGAKKIFRASYG